MISDMVIRDFITWIAAVLSVYRVAHMIAIEDGPFDVFAGTRDIALRLHMANRQVIFPVDKTKKFISDQFDWIYRGLNCPLCISFWIALPAIFVHWVIIDPILAWLSIAGACLILHKKLYLH